TASWTRINSASSPPNRKNTKLVSRYRRPISLWSTVVTQRRSPVGRQGSIAGAGYGDATVAIASSLEALQVVRQRRELVRAQIWEGRHQNTWFDPLRIADPTPHIR